MKYRSILSINPTKCTLGAACSKCGAEVDCDDVYCRKCGHKMRVLPMRLDTEVVLAILTQSITDAEHVGREASGIVTTEPGNDNKTKAHINSTSLRDQCPMWRSEKCDQCDSDGKCLAVVYPTMPPKYQYCPYSGKAGFTDRGEGG